MQPKDGKLVLIGAGMVGSATLNALIALNLLSEVVVIDQNTDKAKGEVMDALHTTAFAYSTNVTIRAGSYADCADAAIIVMTAGPSIQPGDTDRRSLAEKNLMLLSGYDTTIDLVLKGPRSELFKLDKSKVRIVADTSTIQETGQQTLSYQVYFQDDIQRSKISVDHASAYSVTVTVGEMDSKTVPIRCDIVGSTAKGFTAGELTLDPAELNLRGQRDDLLNIAYAKVTLDISGADRTVVQALEWELYDYNDIRIDNPAVRSKVKTVQATLPVKTSKEVDLVVNFVPAAGSTLDTMQYTVSPDKVTLVGEKDVLDTIDAIVLDTLYLQDLQPSQSLTYSVTAPEGTTLAENVGPVTVTIVVTGVTERNVTVTAFNCENVPEGFSAVPVTESLNILLRGLESEMAQITAEDLRITVDLSGITEPGVHTVPVTVQVANYANVGVKGSYQIVVDVERLA